MIDTTQERDDGHAVALSDHPTPERDVSGTPSSEPRSADRPDGGQNSVLLTADDARAVRAGATDEDGGEGAPGGRGEGPGHLHVSLAGRGTRAQEGGEPVSVEITADELA
ncbi:MAG TPA: hypothetical protein VMB05_04975, partial [Solirubrobacteraceae bacterium]|nr:hypothetical protein [Solirubrobacteraceae bacterium]